MSLIDEIKNYVNSTGFEMSYYMQDTQEVFVPESSIIHLDTFTINALLDMASAFGGVRFYNTNVYINASSETQDMFNCCVLYEYIKAKQSFNMSNTFLSDSEVVELANAMRVEYAQELIDSIGNTGFDASQLSEDVYDIVLAKTV